MKIYIIGKIHKHEGEEPIFVWLTKKEDEINPVEHSKIFFSVEDAQKYIDYLKKKFNTKNYDSLIIRELVSSDIK